MHINVLCDLLDVCVQVWGPQAWGKVHTFLQITSAHVTSTYYRWLTCKHVSWVHLPYIHPGIYIKFKNAYKKNDKRSNGSGVHWFQMVSYTVMVQDHGAYQVWLKGLWNDSCLSWLFLILLARYNSFLLYFIGCTWSLLLLDQNNLLTLLATERGCTLLKRKRSQE